MGSEKEQLRAGPKDMYVFIFQICFDSVDIIVKNCLCGRLPPGTEETEKNETFSNQRDFWLEIKIPAVNFHDVL